MRLIDEIRGRIAHAGRILLATDFDGTLCPLAPKPGDVYVPKAIRELMVSFSESQRFLLAVLSGRSLADLDAVIPGPFIRAGNHGLEISGPGLKFEVSRARELAPKIAGLCSELEQVVAGWPGAWVENKTLTATVHYRQVADRDQRAVRRAARQCISASPAPLGMRAGRKALEIYPRVGWDKGAAVSFLRGCMGPFDACICIGDDRTDESMFRENAGEINIKVGPGQTLAGYRLDEQFEVPLLMSALLKLQPNSR